MSKLVQWVVRDCYADGRVNNISYPWATNQQEATQLHIAESRARGLWVGPLILARPA